jgi:hypothetical protein
MGRGILLWLLGVPIPIIILLMFFWLNKAVARCLKLLGGIVCERRRSSL